jgi:glutamate synthase (NADPH/NADH) small chain
MLLTAEGKFLEAAAVIGTMTNLPEVCARLCPADHNCEGQCLLDGVSDPVPIRSLEQFLVDYAFIHGQFDSSAAPPNGFKVAVAGSGAAGLTCADELSRRGFGVTVFDNALVPGGLLVNGTPAFDLDNSIIQRRIELLKGRGVRFEMGSHLWSEVTIERLSAGHDAVFLGVESRKARELQIPGARLNGVTQAIAFLLQKNTAIEMAGPEIDVRGRRVAVIGAGDTAIECARSAIRYHAAQVTVVYRRGEQRMPCARPKYQEAVEEGVRFQFNSAPVEVIGRDGQARAIRLARTDENAGLIAGTEFEMDADWVIAALGFGAGRCPDTDEFAALDKTAAGLLVVDERMMTSRPGVFAAGDIVSGPLPLLETVRDARKAAEAIQTTLVSKLASEKAIRF